MFAATATGGPQQWQEEAQDVLQQEDLPHDFDLDGLFNVESPSGDGGGGGGGRKGGCGRHDSQNGLTRSTAEETSASGGGGAGGGAGEWLHDDDDLKIFTDYRGGGTASSVNSNTTCSTHGPILTVSNYDILLAKSTPTDENDDDPAAANTFAGYTFSPPSHVGNNRLRVIIAMHQPVYEAALAATTEAAHSLTEEGGSSSRGLVDEECNKAASTIVDTLCLNCVPNGRFLEKIELDDGRLAYKDIGSDGARDVVRAFADRCFASSVPKEETAAEAQAQDESEHGGTPPPQTSMTRRRSSVTKPLREGVNRMSLKDAAARAAAAASTSPPIMEEDEEDQSSSSSPPPQQQEHSQQSRQPQKQQRPRFKVKLLRRRQTSKPQSSQSSQRQSQSSSQPQSQQTQSSSTGMSEEEAAQAQVAAAAAAAAAAQAEKKRGRTSSLLRRSRQSVNDITRTIKAVCQRKSRGGKSTRGSDGDCSGDGEEGADMNGPDADADMDTMATLPEGVPKNDVLDSDILVAGEGGEGITATENVGNNRLRVIIDMNRQRYADAKNAKAKDAASKREIAQEILDLCKHKAGSNADTGGGGRFLRQDLLTGLSHEITDSKALQTIQHCLSTKPGKQGACARSVAYVDEWENQRMAREELMRQRQKKAVLEKAVEKRDCILDSGGEDGGGGEGSKKKKKNNNRRKKTPIQLGAASLVQRRDFREIMRLAKSI